VSDHGSSVERAGEVVVARLRGTASEALLREVQEAVLQLAARLARPRVLVELLELNVPQVELAALQRKLDEDRRAAGLRRAIVVPDSRLAYFARLAFGDGNYRIFYNDRAGAMKWLAQELPVRAPDL
jgi:hypothetical protein